MAMTPILAGEEAGLRTYLESFTQLSSPFASLPQTHFGRWVILPDWVDSAQPQKDSLRSQYLIFTSNFDAPLEGYLDELCSLREAGEIWRRCAGCPEPAGGERLKAYLLHNQIDIGFFVAAYKDHTVAEVKDALALRERLMSFAVCVQGLDASALQSEFSAEFGSS